MPTTSYNITRIKDALPSYSREDIRETLNEILLIVYAGSGAQTIGIDSNTGMPPYLATTQGQREYTLGSGVRETIAVFAEFPQRGYSPLRNRSYPTDYMFRNVTYRRVAIRSQNATINTNATLTFVDDPGTTTETYFHEYFKRYTPITSENIQIPLPEELHWKMREAVIAMLGKEDYGDVGSRRALIEKIALEITNKLSKGDQGKTLQTPWQTQDTFGDNPDTYDWRS